MYVSRFTMIPTLLYVAVGFSFFPSYPLLSASKRYDYAEEATTAIREVRDSVEDMRHEVSNHEIEIRTFDEKLRNQAITLDDLRHQIIDTLQTNKEFIKGSSTQLEARVNSLETTLKSLTADMKQLKTHANEVSGSLELYGEKIQRLEKFIEVQNKNIANLEAALTSIASAFEVKESITSPAKEKNKEAASAKKYRIKSGDSLEKIARNNGTTIRILKELNQLTDDRILVGQTIELP